MPYQTIRELYENSDFDFRTFAYPGDPLRDLFEDWVPYYRMKWAIARALQPKRILEIGVRYGYSARTFLDAVPGASYLGIDLDADSYGGIPGALEWAKRICAGHQAEFLLANSQEMTEFPGGLYDLIHVDGQQDRDGFFRDGQKALRQSRNVLVDGYFWSDETFDASNALVRQFKSLIDHYLVIPGYAGDLLIRTSDANRAAFTRSQQPASSEELRDSYTADYYLFDCGGYDSFRRSGGKALEDPRLVGLAALASLRPDGPFLDIGCGRGELAYHLASQGASGTAVDYSADAIRLAEQCFEGSPELRERVELVCGDAITSPWPEKIQVATAGDLVEHLTPEELDRLYARLSANLAPEGVFVVHTFPNLWFYQYGYPKRRKAAMAGGAYLTPEPRSLYEQLMHINEQSPRVLRDQLKKHFAHVLVWFGTPEDPMGSLKETKPQSYFHATRDLFAVASNTAIDMAAVKSALSTCYMMPLAVPRPGEIGIDILEAPSTAEQGQRFNVVVAVTNRSKHRLESLMPNPIHLAYHWVNAETGAMVVYDGMRTRLKTAVRPGMVENTTMEIAPPPETGRYLLQISIVQEMVAWWDGIVQASTEVEIRP